MDVFLHPCQKGTMARTSDVLNSRISRDELVWALGSFCALNRIPFAAELVLKEFPPPYTKDSVVQATRALGFKIREIACDVPMLVKLKFPCLALLREAPASTESSIAASEQAAAEAAGEAPECRLAIVFEANAGRIVYFEGGSNTPRGVTPAEFSVLFAGVAWIIALQAPEVTDPDSEAAAPLKFGFKWFVPELLKHRKVWRDVLLASLVLQLLALGTPLFTQAIIDKVVVHRTESTLIVISIGMIVFMFFTALLTWVRQYLILHTGNRVDAVLGAAVFEHLFKLPPRYFQYRPTGVVAARLHGVETIREFLASAAVSLVLDLPFLLICVGVMFSYSVSLTVLTIGMLSLIVLASVIVAPMFQTRMNKQFQIGARNQAFVTEYIGGFETVKSLQLEPQIRARYGEYTAEYLRAGFQTRQIGNTYNVFASSLEQLMTLLILVGGAWMVMHPSGGVGEVFTIGMLVAFQMFAGKVSQPMLRIVGLWQQFQQSSLSVKRLGDLMNAPTEPYSVVPSRFKQGDGKIEVGGLAFRYADDLPFLYRDFAMTVEPGKVVVIEGPSGSGKSTLAKLLQGFYLPNEGQIKIDGIDTRHLAANELRSYFGVVPQETVLFSGTIYDNLVMANPHATFEQIVQACTMAEIHQVIEQLPKGYKTEIGERGAGLSGGQRQRLAIARALIKRPKILIFDESTSNLDLETAEHFAATINQLRGKVTMIFITHAQPKALKVDEIVHIGGGSPASQVSDPVVKSVRPKASAGDVMAVAQP